MQNSLESYSDDYRVPKVLSSVVGPQKFIAYTEDLADLITNHQLSYHLYEHVYSRKSCIKTHILTIS